MLVHRVREPGERGSFREPAHREVARVHPEHAGCTVRESRDVVLDTSAVGGPYLDQPGAGALQDLRDAEPPTDFDQLAARDHDLATGSQRAERQQHSRGVVVHDQRGVCSDQLREPRVDGRTTPRPHPELQIELERTVAARHLEHALEG